MPLEFFVAREDEEASFWDRFLSNCHAPHDEQVVVGFNVTCVEAVVVLVFSDKYPVGGKGCLDNV